MQDDEEKMQKRLESCSSSTSAMAGEVEYGSASGQSFSYRACLIFLSCHIGGFDWLLFCLPWVCSYVL